jgi:hypothetical protein
MSGSTIRRSGGAMAIAAAGALVLALLPGSGAEAATPAATPDSNCTANGYAPNSLVLGSSPVKKTFSADISGCDVEEWIVGIEPFVVASTTIDGGFATNLKPTITLSPKGLKNSDAGQTGAVVFAFATDDPQDANPAELDTTFQLRRRATWGSTVKATPGTVTAGSKIRVKGTLTRVSWNGKKKATYVPYSKRSVKVQVLPAGDTQWITAATVITDSKGRISTLVDGVTTGTWRLHYGGNSVTGSANSPGVLVTVN